mgnify:CR=1 FL=1
MTQRDIINLTDGIVSMKNENTMLRKSVERNQTKIIELQILIDRFENTEGLIINTLDNTELTDKEKIDIIQKEF